MDDPALCEAGRFARAGMAALGVVVCGMAWAAVRSRWALSALSLGIYMVLSPASAAAQAKREHDNLRDLSTAVDRSFGLLGSFEGVSASRVVQDGLAPTRMVEGEVLRTAWGTAVDIVPHAVKAPADGFMVVYPFAPADVCPRLAAAVARDLYDLRVEGASMFDNGQLNVNATAAACGQHDTATMEFVYHSGLVAGTAVATPPLVLPPVSPSVTPPTSAPMGGPVGPADPVGPAAPVGPVNSAPSVVPVPPSAPVAAPLAAVTPTTPVAATPAPVAPTPTTVAACSVPSPTWDYQNLSCASGSYGTISQSRFATWSCPEAWDAPVQGEFSGWTTTSNTCNACPGPQSETDTLACPGGQIGAITQQRSRSFNCSGTGSWNGWSGWTIIGNSCAPACVAPLPESQWLTSTSACPSGGTQSIEYREQRSASCPSPTGSYVWGNWVDTGDRRNYVACPPVTPACVAPAATAEAITRAAAPENQNVGCPAPQVGEHWQQRSRVENGTRTTSWTCPVPTGSPTSSTVNTWSGTYTATSGWATTSNTCATPAPACASSGDPFTLVRYRACTNSSGKTISGASAQKNPATGDYCTAWMPFSGGYGSPHGANYSGSNSMSIEIAWHGATYVCSYSGYIGSSSSGSVSGSGSLPPGMSCGSVNFFPTSQGWGSGGLNILGPGPQYTTCP